MKIRDQFLLQFSLAVCFMFPFLAHAASGLTVVINGQEIPGTCTAGNCEVDLSAAGPYAGVEITGNSGTPKVKAIEGDPETLVLEKATIKALQVTEHVITFWATFAQPPVTNSAASPPVRVKYDRTADGSMMRGTSAAKNDKFTINGWVDDLTDSSEAFTVDPTQYKLVTCLTPTCPASYGTFSLATSLERTTGFTGDRVLKIEIKFDAKYVNDKLNVTSVQLVGSTQTAGPKVPPSIGAYDAFVEEYIIQREKERAQKNK